MECLPKEENSEGQLIRERNSVECAQQPLPLFADALKEEESDPMLAQVNGSSHLRPRGTYDTTLPRVLPKLTGSFEECSKCQEKLAGCITSDYASTSNMCPTTIMTCGHIVCPSCLEEAYSPSTSRRQYKCYVCNEFVAKIKLPSKDSVNFAPCQAPYCNGESLAVPQARCITCQRQLCEDCLVKHSEKFPRGDHKIEKRPHTPISRSRAFASCSFHQQTVHARCTCGEMVCEHCHISDTSRGRQRGSIIHEKIPFEESDPFLEDAIQDVKETLQKLKRMRVGADLKQKELAEMVDRMNNEIAIHFNQIILQAIQRCFDVMNAVKVSAAPHYEDLNEHIAHINTLERKLVMGIAIDERARDRTAVTSESVADYVRHAAYTLCGPVIEQMVQVEAQELHFANCKYSIVLPKIDTVSIMENISKWGEVISADFSTTHSSIETILDPTATVPVLSMHNGLPIRGPVLLKGQIDAKVIPLRLHSALDHFTELHERRFDTVSCPVDSANAIKRNLPFQLGERTPPEATFTAREVADRFTYEKSILARGSVAGTMNLGPKIFGGYKNIYNLRNTSMKERDIQETFSRTPTIPPIWEVSDKEHRLSNGVSSQQRSRPVSQIMEPSITLPSTQPQPPHRVFPANRSAVLRKNNMVLIRRGFPPTSSIPSHNGGGNGNVASATQIKSLDRAATSDIMKTETSFDEDIEVDCVKLNDPALPSYKSPLPILDFKLDYADDAERICSHPSTSGTSYREGMMYRQEERDTLPQSTTHRIAQTGRTTFPVLWQGKQKRQEDSQFRKKDALVQPEEVHEVDVPQTRNDRASWMALTEREKDMLRKDAIERAKKCTAMRRVHEETNPRINQLHTAGRENGVRIGVGRGIINGNGEESEKNLLAPEGGGCFVCNLVRTHHGKSRSYQCAECLKIGRALTPLKDEELEQEKFMAKKRRIDENDKNRVKRTHRSSSNEEEKEEEPEVRRSGRARKAPAKFY